MAEITNGRLTPKQAATLVGVSVSLIYKWTTQERRLPHFRLGGSGFRGRIVVERADLLAFLAAQKVGGDEPGRQQEKTNETDGPTQLDLSRLVKAWQAQGVLSRPMR